jgi:xyloglucan-specific exo-beta-1,4-glucanase
MGAVLLSAFGVEPPGAPATSPSSSTSSPSATFPASAPASRPVVTTRPYRWRQVNDAAGGDCTGIYFHSADASIRYVTSGETGGYRWDYDTQRWLSFTDWNTDARYTAVAGLALDSQERHVVYYAAGSGEGEIFKSFDGGRTFTPSELRKPDGSRVRMDGPRDAATGERLVVDPNNRAILYYASRLDGLWCSLKGSAPASWRKVESFTARGDVDGVRDAEGKSVREAAAGGGR